MDLYFNIDADELVRKFGIAKNKAVKIVKDIKTEVIVGEKKRGRKAKEHKEEVIDAEVVEKEPTLFNDVAENAPIDNQQETTQTDQAANNEPETKELLELKEKVLKEILNK